MLSAARTYTRAYLIALRGAWVEYREACAALAENERRERKAGVAGESAEYLRLNAEVWRTRDALPVWLRLVTY